jgi:hypothetical protein
VACSKAAPLSKIADFFLELSFVSPVECLLLEVASAISISLGVFTISCVLLFAFGLLMGSLVSHCEIGDGPPKSLQELALVALS